jgi:hypothetical protein
MVALEIKETGGMWPSVERSLGITGCGGWSNGMEEVVGGVVARDVKGVN